MADPLSPLASMVTVVGSAIECAKILSKTLRRFKRAPAEVHQWLEMLESLHLTLTSLENCSLLLDLRYRFSAQFGLRLKDCLTHLQSCIDRIGKIDTELERSRPTVNRTFGGRTKRSWQRVRWIVVDDYTIKKLVEMIKIYQFEFSMELFKLLL